MTQQRTYEHLQPCPACGAHRWQQDCLMRQCDTVRCRECNQERDAETLRYARTAVEIGRD